MNITRSMCWNLIARQVQTAVWVKQDNESCHLQESENKLFGNCDIKDDFQTSWKVPLSNCIRANGVADSNQKMPPRRERLHIYSKSLGSFGQ